MHEINEILVRNRVLYYLDAQKQRINGLYDPKYYKSYVVEWHKNIKNMIEQDNRPELNHYVQNQEINIKRRDASCIKIWILGVLKMRKLTKETKENNTRRYFKSVQLRKDA